VAAPVQVMMIMTTTSAMRRKARRRGQAGPMSARQQTGVTLRHTHLLLLLQSRVTLCCLLCVTSSLRSSVTG